MRVAIPHDLTREELRRRLHKGGGDIASYIPFGGATVETDWPSEDRMAMTIRAMGQTLRGHVDIEDTEVVFVVVLPPLLGFVEPMVAASIRQGGQRLVEKRPEDEGGPTAR